LRLPTGTSEWLIRVRFQWLGKNIPPRANATGSARSLLAKGQDITEPSC
jgi:hypothetical protein